MTTSSVRCRRPWPVAAWVLAATVVAGCGTPSPTAPTPSGPQPVSPPGPLASPPVEVPVAPPGGAPTAMLAITAFALGPAIPAAGGSGVVYIPTLELRETSGQSDARIISLVFTLADTNYIIAPGCLKNPLVPKGGTWSASTISSYCNDVGYMPVEHARVQLSFADEAGRIGSVSASVLQIPAR